MNKFSKMFMLIIAAVCSLAIFSHSIFNATIHFVNEAGKLGELNFHHATGFEPFQCEDLSGRLLMFKENANNRENAEIHFQRAMCRYLINIADKEYSRCSCNEPLRKWTEKALGDIEQAILIEPEYSDAYTLKGLILSVVIERSFDPGYMLEEEIRERKELIQELSETITTITSLDKTNGIHYFILYRILSRLGDDDASDFFQLSLTRNCPLAFAEKARIEYLHSQFNEAISDITKAIELDNNRPRYFRIRSNCLRAQGNFNQAAIDTLQYIYIQNKDSHVILYEDLKVILENAFRHTDSHVFKIIVHSPAKVTVLGNSEYLPGACTELDRIILIKSENEWVFSEKISMLCL